VFTSEAMSWFTQTERNTVGPLGGLAANNAKVH